MLKLRVTMLLDKALMEVTEVMAVLVEAAGRHLEETMVKSEQLSPTRGLSQNIRPSVLCHLSPS